MIRDKKGAGERISPAPPPMNNRPGPAAAYMDVPRLRGG